MSDTTKFILVAVVVYVAYRALKGKCSCTPVAASSLSPTAPMKATSQPRSTGMQQMRARIAPAAFEASTAGLPRPRSLFELRFG